MQAFCLHKQGCIILILRIYKLQKAVQKFGKQACW